MAIHDRSTSVAEAKTNIPSEPSEKPASSKHSIISPAILYFGTPVVLVSSTNPSTHSTRTNLCAISSCWWLGRRCVLGFGAESQTPHNILRTGKCVLNLPSDNMAAAVNALASTTGTQEPSAGKISRGYRFVDDKFAVANLTPQKSELVEPDRVLECPVQMECELVTSHQLFSDVPEAQGLIVAMEFKVIRIHMWDELRMSGYSNRVDPDKWRPMIMSFSQLYGIKDRKVESVLAEIDEEEYRPFAAIDEKTENELVDN